MDAMLQAPSATAFDAVASAVCLLVFLAVAAAALLRAPRDARARVFCLVALTSAVPYALTPLQWWKGNGVYGAGVIALTSLSICAGSPALFHFTQVFPYRRPWIRRHFLWLAAAYVVLPLPAALVAWIVMSQLAPAVADTGAGGLGAVSPGFGLAAVFLLVIPLVFLAGLVLPFSGVMSLFQSWKEARAAGDEPARATTLWILLGQMAGGVLAILVVPLLHVVGIGAPWSTGIAALTYAFGLLTPASFAVAVFSYGVLSRDAPLSTSTSPE
jgi:hypothetical protein